LVSRVTTRSSTHTLLASARVGEPSRSLGVTDGSQRQAGLGERLRPLMEIRDGSGGLGGLTGAGDFTMGGQLPGQPGERLHPPVGIGDGTGEERSAVRRGPCLSSCGTRGKAA
jgi:hypothetical protein